MTSVPSVMVSSTFYDLKQIRADLAQFIADELGYVPLFPSCRRFLSIELHATTKDSM